jgi:hypothetical protein
MGTLSSASLRDNSGRARDSQNRAFVESLRLKCHGSWRACAFCCFREVDSTCMDARVIVNVAVVVVEVVVEIM